MAYASLEACLIDLEKNGHLIRIKEEVDPHLEMAAIHLRVYDAQGPALLFENVKGSKYRAASNIFGTLDRSKFIFRDTLAQVQQMVQLKNDPMKALKSPLKNVLDIMPMETDTIEFLANEEGDWFFHCHIRFIADAYALIMHIA